MSLHTDTHSDSSHVCSSLDKNTVSDSTAQVRSFILISFPLKPPSFTTQNKYFSWCSGSPVSEHSFSLVLLQSLAPHHRRAQIKKKKKRQKEINRVVRSSFISQNRTEINLIFLYKYDNCNIYLIRFLLRLMTYTEDRNQKDKKI